MHTRNKSTNELLTDLHDPNHVVAFNAARALGFQNDRQAVIPLIAVLHTHADAGVRANAAWALGKLTDDQAVEPLIGSLADPNREVRYWAATALGMLGGQTALSALERALAIPDENDSVLRQIITALKSHTYKPASFALLQLFYTPQPRAIYQEIAAALCALGDAHIPALIRVIQDPSCPGREGATMALGWLRATAAVEPLIRLMEPTDDLAYAAAVGLGMIGDKRARAPLLLYAGDRTSRLHEPAVSALGTCGDERDVVFLLDLLSAPEGSTRERAAIALGTLAAQQAVQPLIRVLLHDPETDVRASAADALGEIGNRQAIPALEHVMVNDKGATTLGGMTMREIAEEARDRIQQHH